MEKGRSVFTFNINCNPSIINNLIQSYIKGNNYTLEDKNGEQFYKAGDSMVGYRYFNYSLVNNQLVIYAWFHGLMGDTKVEDSNTLNVMAMNYRNSLNALFQEIIKLNNNGGMNMNEYENKNFENNVNTQMNFDPMTGQPVQNNVNNTQMNFDPMTGQPIQNNSNQFTQKFQDETTKKQENMCEIGFWFSILGIIISILGVSFGVLVYVLNFYFASQGLKTRKRGKAIATIVISIISILITIFQVMLAA